MLAKYSVLIQFDGIDNIYVASVPEISGCMAHGDTYENALEEIKSALELRIETAYENNADIPKPALCAG